MFTFHDALLKLGLYVLLIKSGKWVGFAIFLEYKREREKATEENRGAAEKSWDGG